MVAVVEPHGLAVRPVDDQSMTEKDERNDYSNHHQRDQFPHMKRDQRNRSERGQLAVKIVCATIASVLAGAFLASELFALSTRFSPSLGEHYFYLYPPWAVIDWWSKWHSTSPAMFTQPLQVGAAVAAALLIAYSIHVVTRAQALRQYSDIHGSARWAKLSDIKKAGLLQPQGVYRRSANLYGRTQEHWQGSPDDLRGTGRLRKGFGLLTKSGICPLAKVVEEWPTTSQPSNA